MGTLDWIVIGFFFLALIGMTMNISNNIVHKKLPE